MRRCCSSCEKSISASASSIRRFWSALSSVLRVTFSAASSESDATSLRISPSAACVACSIWRWVSSMRRWRSCSTSPRTRSESESPTLRASARISSAWPFAWPISARCSSSRLFASARACSASAIDCSMRVRRSSIVFWIGPKANFLSTKRVIRNETIVQIIRPGLREISALAATSIVRFSAL